MQSNERICEEIFANVTYTLLKSMEVKVKKQMGCPHFLYHAL